jgi:hypothetical protein
MGGGSQNVKQTTEVKLTPEQKQMIAQGMDLTGQVTNNPDGLPKIPGPAEFNPIELAAQSGMVSKASSGGSLDEFTNKLLGANQFLLGDVMDVNNNQGLKGAIDAAIRPMEDQFTRVLRPGIDHQSVGTGEFSSFGGTKNILANDLANRNYSQSIRDTTNDLVDRTYTANLDAMTRGVGMAPQTQRAAIMPETVLAGVGDQQRQLEQGKAQAGFENSMFPFNLGLQLMGAAGGMPGAGTTANVQGAKPGGNPFLSMLGTVLGGMAFGPIGASAGGSLGGMI